MFKHMEKYYSAGFFIFDFSKILLGQMYARKNTILLDFSFFIFQKIYWAKCLPEVVV